MTELSPLAIVTPENIAKIGSCGVLLPNTKGKIVDLETGDALGPHEKGELCIKGPQVKKRPTFHLIIITYISSLGGDMNYKTPSHSFR